MTRQSLIESHLYLCRLTVDRLRVPPRYREEADAEARYALCRAADRYDPTRGVAFATWAIHYLRGAILEYLRNDDWVPRSVRTREKAGLPVSIPVVLSLETLLADCDNLQISDTLIDPQDVEAEVVERLAGEALWREVGFLPRSEAATLRGHYADGLTYAQIAAGMGRSEARAGQYQEQGIKRLQERLAP